MRASRPAGGDPNGDGIVSSEDISLVLVNWGRVEASIALVPEPGCAIALAAGAGALLLRRRRRSSRRGPDGA